MMAVIVNNVHFYHQNLMDKSHILKGVNLNVPYGSIYGLLGPSGCGKTTLLKCIIGFLRPKSGQVSVFGFEPGDERSGVPGTGVGYMPQELALQYDLTIDEILKYFGKLNCMEKEHLNVEIDFLVKILELYDKHRVIGNLSGGQKRRVSLAIAMLHKPKLLILDEPTVGVDPVLREVIWKLMISLSSTQKTTIIITTHYIEETRRADVVALMRHGTILEENSPKSLLLKYDAINLDDVFLKVCIDQKYSKHSSDRTTLNKNSISSYINYDSNNNNNSNNTSGYICNQSEYNYSNVQTFSDKFKHFFNVLFAVVWKYMIETRRNPSSVLVVIGTTAAIISAVYIVLGRTPHDLPVAWVVEELAIPNNFSSYNNSYENESSENKTLDESEENLYLPEILRESINNKIIKLIDYENISDAFRDAKMRKVHGILHLKRNFTDSFLESDPFFSARDDFVSNETVNGGSIHMHLDVANLVISKVIEAVVLESTQKFRMKLAPLFDMNPLLFSTPVIVVPVNSEDKPIKSIEDVFSVATFVTPGLVASFLFALSVGLSSLTLLSPAECDMFVRNYSSGVKPVHTFFGQIIARFVLMSFNAIINLFAMVYFLGVPCNGSVPLIITIMWMQIFLGLSFGIAMSSSMSNSMYSLFTALGITVLILVTNGVIWGIEGQPYYMKWMTQYSPLYYSVNTLRALLFYSNAPFALIWPGFLSTFLWIVFAVLLSFVIMSFKK